MAKNSKSIIRSAAATALIAAIFFFLGRRLYIDARELGIQDWSVDPVRLVLSFVLLLASLALSALTWKKTLRLFGVDLGLAESFKITFTSSVGKYLPGKIWAYMTQVYLGHSVGIPKGICAISAAVVFLAYNLSGLLVFTISLLSWDVVPRFVIAILVALLVSLLLSLFSRKATVLMVRVGSRISRRFHEEVNVDEMTLRTGAIDVGQVLLVLAADWMLFCVGVYLLLNAFYGTTASEALVVCGSLVVSVIAGMLSFFVPAGLGVREGVHSYLLSLFMPTSVGIVIALALRIWLTVGDVLCFLAALQIKRPRLL